MQLLDVVITSVGIIVFGIRIALYSIIVVYLTAKVSDRIMEGSTSAKMLYIISDQSTLIAEKIMEKISRGVTGLQEEACTQIKTKLFSFVLYLLMKLLV